MALISRKAFAAMCGETPEKLNVYIGRDKVTVSAENKKLIDTENPKNVQFFNERTGQNKVPNPKNTSQTAEKPVKKAPKSTSEPAEPREIRTTIAMQAARDQKRVDQDNLKKERELQLTDLNIEHKRLLLSKSAGKLLPVDLARGVITRHGNTFLTTFEKGIERIVEIFVNIMAGGDPKMRSRILAETKIVLEKCVHDAGEKAALEIETLIDEYSETLLKGQKKI